MKTLHCAQIILASSLQLVHLYVILLTEQLIIPGKNKNLHPSPSALSLSVPASAYCLAHMCALGSCCAVECIALSTGDVWEWFVGRWKWKTQMSPARIKCGESTGVRANQLTESLAAGNLHWKTNYCSVGGIFCKHKNAMKTFFSAGNNCKASNNVPFFVAFTFSQMPAEQNLRKGRQKTTLVLLCGVCGLRSGMTYTAQRCSRWHVGGSGWRRRESVCGQPWLMATEQQSPSQCCTIHLCIRLGEYSSLPRAKDNRGVGVCHVTSSAPTS